MRRSDKFKTVLITGASSGIGYELTKIFARQGFNVILVARSEFKLVNIALELTTQYKVQAIPIAKDLSQPNAAVELYDLLQQRNIQVDILINNAGFGAFGHFIETDWEEEQQMMDVNMRLLTHITKLFVNDMVRRGHGKVLNVASTAAFQPGPLMAVYYATKEYVLSFSEALANELLRTGVSVSCLCPGPTQTEFHARADMNASRMVTSNLMMDSGHVARVAFKGLFMNKRVIIPGMKNKMLVQALRLLPRKLVTSIVRRFQESRANAPAERTLIES